MNLVRPAAIVAMFFAPDLADMLSIIPAMRVVFKKVEHSHDLLAVADANGETWPSIAATKTAPPHKVSRRSSRRFKTGMARADLATSPERVLRVD